jgi:hypothetical protein
MSDPSFSEETLTIQKEVHSIREEVRSLRSVMARLHESTRREMVLVDFSLTGMAILILSQVLNSSTGQTIGFLVATIGLVGYSIETRSIRYFLRKERGIQ